MWRSLIRWSLRRPPVLGPGEEPFGYASPMTGFIWALIVVSLVEIPAVHVILPWRTARLILLPLGVYGLFAMLAMLASLRMNPHLVGPAGLRLRYATGFELLVPWDAMESASHRLHATPEGGTVHAEETDEGRLLHIGVSKQTNVDVRFREPTRLELPRGKTETVTQIRFWADEPGRLVESIRSRLVSTS